MAPEVSEEEGSYALHFYRWLEKVIKSCLLLLVVLPSLIDTLCRAASLKVPAIIVYDVTTKVLDTELFP